MNYFALIQSNNEFQYLKVSFNVDPVDPEFVQIRMYLDGESYELNVGYQQNENELDKERLVYDALFDIEAVADNDYPGINILQEEDVVEKLQRYGDPNNFTYHQKLAMLNGEWDEELEDANQVLIHKLILCTDNKRGKSYYSYKLQFTQSILDTLDSKCYEIEIDTNSLELRFIRRRDFDEFMLSQNEEECITSKIYGNNDGKYSTIMKTNFPKKLLKMDRDNSLLAMRNGQIMYYYFVKKAEDNSINVSTEEIPSQN